MSRNRTGSGGIVVSISRVNIYKFTGSNLPSHSFIHPFLAEVSRQPAKLRNGEKSGTRYRETEMERNPIMATRLY